MGKNPNLFPLLNIEAYVGAMVPSQKKLENANLNYNRFFFSCRLEEIDISEEFLQNLHICDFFAIYFVTAGHIEKNNQLKRLRIGKNEMFFSKPGEVKTWRNLFAQKGFIVLFTQDFLLTVVDNKNLINTFDYLVLNTVRKFIINSAAQKIFNKIFNEILQEFLLDEKHGQDLIKFWICILLMKTNRYFIESAQQFDEMAIKGSANHTYNRFLNLLDESYTKLVNRIIHRPYRVKEYAKMLNMHPSYFGECIKKASGKSAKTLIDERTILLAKCQLLHTGHTVSEIAYSLGFESLSYFIRFFKKYQQMTPLEFKRAQRQTA